MALFVLFLSVLQCAVALTGGLVAHVLTNVPRWRPLRGRAIRAAVFAAIGGFVGGLVGYAIAAAGIGSEIPIVPIGGCYLFAFLWGGRLGWLRGDLAPDFEHDPIR